MKRSRAPTSSSLLIRPWILAALLLAFSWNGWAQAEFLREKMRANEAQAAASVDSRYEVRKEGRLVQEIKSVAIESFGTRAEIASRAQGCMVRIIKAEGTAVGLLDSSTTFKSTNPTIELFDPEAGLVAGNLTAAYAVLGTGLVAKGRLNVETKDGRFRMSVTGPTVTGNTGQAFPLGKGINVEKGISAITDVTDEIAACISTPPSADEW